MRKIFVTGISTNVGKTVVSSVLVESLAADYWKPIQAGTGVPTDSDQVKKCLSNENSIIHPEAYRLIAAISPHAAAALEGIEIDPEKIVLPNTSRTLIIEGAGGLLVPLNNKYFMVDLINKFEAEVILVIKNYLGSINHTLLTIDFLKSRGIPIVGLVFNGETNTASEKLILEYSKIHCILRLNKEEKIDKNCILKYSKLLKEF